MRRIISYFRVSTQKQGQSGLGLEAQRKALADFLNGGRWEIVAEFVEVESGKRDDRPELRKAIDHARRTGATLVVAKLDRLARDAHFLLGLQKAGIKFVAADMPEANEAMVGFMAVFAQYERQLISKRTKEALAAAKARGVKLGNPNGAAPLRRAAKGNMAAVAALKSGADQRARDLAGIVADDRANGASSYAAVADVLNRQGIATARGGRWHACTVRDLERRAFEG
jgi:DNA invertase Pin-like site-specific DNA recombinase